MKKQTILNGLMMLALAGTASATIVENNDYSVGLTILDNQPSGLAVAQTFSGLSLGDLNQGINGVDVRLNISGGFNGDLYGYLVLQSDDGHTVSSILLNRVGTGGGNIYGSSGSGFNVTLSDSGAQSIHGATGLPTGVWQTDQSGGASSLNSAFGGRDANGTWTLFLADLSAGGQGTLVSWGLNISVVPEPVTWALLLFGSGLGLVLVGRRWRATAGR